MGKIYEITSQLDQREPEEVLFYAVQVLSRLMETQDAAIYTVANRDYARLFSFTSPTAKRLGKSIRYSDMEDMVTELRDHRVYINKRWTTVIRLWHTPFIQRKPCRPY